MNLIDHLSQIGNEIYTGHLREDMIKKLRHGESGFLGKIFFIIPDLNIVLINHMLNGCFYIFPRIKTDFR